MRLFLLVFFFCWSLTSIAQVDTIYTNSEKIACSIKEVTPDAVQFVYPGESTQNSLYKNTIHKIVFRSGRTQTFSESVSLAPISNIEDYDKVTITQVEGEVKGLYKVGEVSSSARGGSVYSNVDRVKERALKKLKMEAVMRGANLIYMAYQKTDGNHYGGYFQASKAAETIYTGTAYSSTTPNRAEFLKKIAGADLLVSRKQIVLLKGMAISKSEYDIEPTNTEIRIRRSYEEGSQLYLEATIQGFEANSFRVVRFDANTFTLLAEDKRKVVNYIVAFK